MNKQAQYTSIGLSFFLGLSILLFFGYFYRFHLLYHEQFQLFLFTSDYWTETAFKPGGFAEYSSRFLTQFYVFPWLGGFIIAILLTFIQRQILFVSLRIRNKPAYIPLTFIPSLFYWMLLCEEHFMLSGVVSLVISLSALRLYLSIPSAYPRIIYASMIIPMLYWLAGGTFLIFGIGCITFEISNGKLEGRQKLFLGVYLLIILLPPLLAKYIIQYPLLKLWIGGDFYRFQSVCPPTLLVLWISVILTPILFRYLPACTNEKKNKTGLVILTLIIVLCTTFGISRLADWEKEEVMTYDYYARTRQWDQIIRLADKKTPMSPLSVSLLNLALCKEKLMPDRMFNYYQNGAEGLIPSFVRDFTIPMMTGEVYYHLGFVNTAQRFAFEAMEAIPDYQKSGRAIRRLAETNLINGQYAVAKKHLHILQHTLFYKKWAAETLACLNDEKQIEANAEWAELRKYQTKTDFLFSEQEKNMMLGIILEQDLTNRMAYEYLMAYCLLTKNIKSFFNYYPLGKKLNYQQIPKSYQEALIYIWGLSNKDLNNISYPINSEIKRQVQEYRQIYTSQQNAETLLKSKYSSTYWYYLHYRK